MKYYIIDNRMITDNTPEFGYGDYHRKKWFVRFVVEADTPRKAQNAAKKLCPGLRFGGRWGAQVSDGLADEWSWVVRDYHASKIWQAALVEISTLRDQGNDSAADALLDFIKLADAKTMIRFRDLITAKEEA